LLGSV